MIRESGNTIGLITPDYSPPITLSQDLNRQLEGYKNLVTHVAVVDRDVVLPKGFYSLIDKYPGADIIGIQIIPSSFLFRIWEETMFQFLLKPRVRDCAVIYNMRFLLEQNGFPDSETPGSLLRERARQIVVEPLRAVHHQPFSLKHSVSIQIRDGRSRARMRYSFWKTLLHSIFRVRPLVFTAYLFYRYRGERMEFGHPW